MVLPADKGRATVVLDKTEYEQKVQHMLDNERTYKKLQKDATAVYKRKRVSILTWLKDKETISHELYSHLYPTSEKAPQLYCLPKVHRYSSHSRMLLLAWPLEPENSTTSYLWCSNFTGYQSGKGPDLRQQFWSSSAFMDWLWHICLSTASWRPDIHICNQPTCACCLFQTDNLRRQEFCCQWTSHVEQFTCGTAIKWRHGGDFQKTAEDISV